MYVTAYTHERKPYSDILYPTSFNLDSLPALTICVQRKTYGWCFTLGPMVCVEIFVRLYVFGREGRKTHWATGGPSVLGTNRVDSRSFSSRCWAFRRTHTSTDPLWLYCIRLVLPLTLSLPSGFAPGVRLTVCVSPRALWLVGDFFRDCTFGDERGR